MNLIDTHSHLHFPDYAADRELCLARMKEKGIGSIVVGTTLGTSKQAIEFAESQENIWAAVGYHPEHFSSSFAYQGEEDKGEYSIETLRALAKSSKKVIAIGETGLDFYRMDEGIDIEQAKKKQEQGFREQLQLATELGLTLIIHCRDAFDEVARVLKEEQALGRSPRTVIHCFTGTWKQAQALLELGCWLSFSGIITFPPKKSQDPELAIQRVVERMQMEKILIETDAPFLAPVPHRGERNEPSFVDEVAKTVAQLRNMELHTCEKQLLDNSRQAFFL